MCFLQDINTSHKYLSDTIPSSTRRYSSRDANNISLVRVNNNYFMNTPFPSTITEWNKLDLSIRKSTSFNIFKSRLLRFVRPLENSVFTCHNPIGIKYLTRIRLGFSHLRYHKFKHGFLDATDPLCSCSTGIENTVHYFLHCPTGLLLIKIKSKLFKLSFMETQPIVSIIIN